MPRSIASACLRLTGLFEAEILTELMLRYWGHPLANDAEYRNSLLEATAEVLRASVAGEKLIDGLSPLNVNFVAAMWYAESVTVSSSAETSAKERRLRKQWLAKVQKAIPSCFCDPDELR
jgi:hypothetical protein